MKKDNLEVRSERCTECMSCQLMCSLTYAGAFNPEEARIVINPPEPITFTDDCVEGCSLCTGYCVYGAISRKKEA